MRPQPPDEPFDEDLEHGRADEAVQQANDRVVRVPETADADLHAQDDKDWDQAGQQCGRPDGDDVLPQRVREFRIHDVAGEEGDGEGTRRSWTCIVHTQSDGAHGGHGQEVQPGEFQPLSETWPPVVVTAVHVEEGASLLLALMMRQAFLLAISVSAPRLGGGALPVALHAAEEAADTAAASAVGSAIIVVTIIIASISAANSVSTVIFEVILVLANCSVVVSKAGICAIVAEGVGVA